MLFGYPPEANADNWVHDCMIEVLTRVHDDIRGGNDPPDWKDIIPIQYRDDVKPKHGIKSRLKEYVDAFKTLTRSEQDDVADALTAQNRLADLVNCSTDCKNIDELPEQIRKPAVSLFTFVFEKLTDFGVRDAQYRIVYDRAPDALCPFCGLERFEKPGRVREAEDHYLPKSSYPFAGANLWNLVPMGNKCNSGYKRTANPLLHDGRRIRAVNPFLHDGIAIKLTDSDPFGGRTEQTPAWVVTFEPDCEEAETWDIVFDIRQRFVDNVLNVSYVRWLREFSVWCARSNHDEDALNDALGEYVEYWAGIGFEDRAFFRVAVFEMLSRHCRAGNDRLIAILKESVRSERDAMFA